MLEQALNNHTDALNALCVAINNIATVLELQSPMPQKSPYTPTPEKFSEIIAIADNIDKALHAASQQQPAIDALQDIPEPAQPAEPTRNYANYVRPLLIKLAAKDILELKNLLAYFNVKKGSDIPAERWDEAVNLIENLDV